MREERMEKGEGRWEKEGWRWEIGGKRSNGTKRN
jgi:hypothetical protein